MSKLILDIPTIAITGSSGKTTTREMVSSILETKWKVLKTKDNKNLPNHIKETLKNFDSSYQAILLELGMGKKGQGLSIVVLSSLIFQLLQISEQRILVI